MVFLRRDPRQLGLNEEFIMYGVSLNSARPAREGSCNHEREYDKTIRFQEQ